MTKIAKCKNLNFKGSVSIRPFSCLNPIFFIFILYLICIDCLTMQYQLVWFTGFQCMHDLSGWGNSFPLKVWLQKSIFFYSKFILQNGGCNRKSTLLDLKDDDNIVLKFIPE